MEKFSTNNKHYTILIVDDQPDNISFLVEVLETAGYSVTFALNGLEALQRLSGVNVDLILLDLFMPDLDGFWVCDRLSLVPPLILPPLHWPCAVLYWPCASL